MTHELVPQETPQQTEWINAIEEDLEGYILKYFKIAVKHAEEMKAGSFHPDIQTAEVLLETVNNFLKVETPHFFPKYEYKLKESGGTYSVYQNVDVEGRNDKGNDDLEPA